MIFPNIMNIIKRIFIDLYKYDKGIDSDNVIDSRILDNSSEWFLSGHLFITYLAKQKKKVLLLPSNFNPDRHIVQFPPYENNFPNNIKFNIDKMKYFLSLLSEIPANNKDLVSEDGFVPIFSTLIRDHFKDYLCYVKYLTKTEVIVCNESFKIGKKSKSYKWAELYENSEFIIANYSVVNEDNEEESTTNLEETIEDYPYLNYWYQQKKLTINYSIAYQYAKTLRAYKIQDRERWDNADEIGKKKNPQTQYKAILYNIESVNNYDYKLLIDSNVHRLHSALTNMQKDYRNLLSYNNQSLVSIDVKNCQPYLACALFNPEFWNPDSNLPLNLKSLPLNIQSKLNEFTISIMLGNFFRRQRLNEFNEYAYLVSSGRMYETIIEIVRTQRGVNISRSTAKATMFSLIFSKNKGMHFNPNKYLLDVYKVKFPAVTKLFSIIKTAFRDGDKVQHNRLACLLQSIESEIILHRCCKRIWEEGEHKIPVFTIHDSIVTTVDNLEFVKKIMQEELTRNIGIAPSLSIEHWDVSNLNQDFLT